MKVLITTPNLEKHGGVANYFATLKKYFSISAEFFTIGSRGYRESALRTPTRLIRDNWSFYRKLRENNYDIVHLNPSLGWKAVLRDGALLLIAKHLKHTVIVFFRGWDKEFESRLTGLRLKLFKSIYFRVDAFIVLANEFRESLRQMGYTGAVYVGTTIVDDSVFDYFESYHTTVQVNDKFNILFLTRIKKTKGVYEAIESYAKLKETHDNIKFTIAGDGSELANVKRYVYNKGLKDVEFKGFVSGNQKLNTYIDADCYLFPSYTEGMPNSVLEAMSLGLPVITRPVGGLKDFFEDGKMGFITESLEPSVFADQLEKLIEKPQLRKQMAEYNHQYGKKRFMASNVAKRLEDIYHQVLIS